MPSLALVTVVLLVVVLVLLGWLALRLAAATPQADAAAGIGTVIDRLERQLRDEVGRSATATRAELSSALGVFQQTVQQQQADIARGQAGQIEAFRVQLGAMQTAVAQTLQAAAGAQAAQAHATRDAQDLALKRFSDAQSEQLRALSEANERRLGEVKSTVEQRLAAMQQGNEAKLEQMRATVDEKLHATLEARLGESFKHVAERLELVHRGLGEMQVLAKDVGSLNRVLNNVKTRGTYGEVQLGAMLEQVFASDHYAANVEVVPGSNARVDYAVRLPGHRGDGVPLWLPIDAKFPRDDYERLLDAQEHADPVAAEAAGKALEMRLRLEARTIGAKYISPPHTTDFALLFVPTEGLYAEALRRPGLTQGLQLEHRVSLVGPTTLLATLTSLQMGFRTMALRERSVEVWETLGAVKTEFGKFGDVLAKTKKKLAEASNLIESAEQRSRVMHRTLRGVEALPDTRAQVLLPMVEIDAEAEGSSDN